MSGAVVHRKLKFGPFEFSVGERVLRRDGQVLPLDGRALDILIYLVDRSGEVIAKQELIDRVWSDVTVEEGSLRVHVAAIRKALGDGQFGNRYILPMPPGPSSVTNRPSRSLSLTFAPNHHERSHGEPALVSGPAVPALRTAGGRLDGADERVAPPLDV